MTPKKAPPLTACILQDLARAHGSAKYGSNGFEAAASGKGVLPEDVF